jgi:hypothetical protein
MLPSGYRELLALLFCIYLALCASRPLISYHLSIRPHLRRDFFSNSSWCSCFMGFSIFLHTCYLGLFPKYPDCILLCITKEHDWVFVWRGELPVKFYGGVTGLLILVHFFGVLMWLTVSPFQIHYLICWVRS